MAKRNWRKLNIIILITHYLEEKEMVEGTRVHPQ